MDYVITKGFIEKCAEAGLTDEQTELLKRAFLENINWSDPRIWGGLAGAGLGAFGSGMAGQSPLAGLLWSALGGAGGAGLGHMWPQMKQQWWPQLQQWWQGLGQQEQPAQQQQASPNPEQIMEVPSTGMPKAGAEIVNPSVLTQILSR